MCTKLQALRLPVARNIDQHETKVCDLSTFTNRDRKEEGKEKATEKEGNAQHVHLFIFTRNGKTREKVL
jgi:hypothetical protein